MVGSVHMCHESAGPAGTLVHHCGLCLAVLEHPLERDQSLLYASVRCGAGCVLRLGRRMLEKNRVLCKQTHGVTTSGRKHAYACFPLRTPPRRNKPQQAATSRNTPQDNSSTELRFSITTTDRSRSQLQPKQRNEPKWPKTRRNMSNTGLT